LNRQPADGAAVLHVLAVENVAAGLDGGGDAATGMLQPGMLRLPTWICI